MPSNRLRIYWKWNDMMKRCYNIKNDSYYLYGKRGIKVIKYWHNFESFYKDMKDSYIVGLTLDRKDNNKNYSKNNCKWSTIKEQANNKRTNHFITFKGIRKTLAQWSERLGIKQSTIRMRISIYNWSINKALSKKPYGITTQ